MSEFPFFTNFSSSSGMLADVSATIACAVLSELFSPAPENPPSGSCMAERHASALSVVFFISALSLYGLSA